MTAGSTTEYEPHADPRKMTRAQLIRVVEQHRQRIASLVAMIDEGQREHAVERSVLRKQIEALTKWVDDLKAKPKWSRCDNCGREIASADRAERRRRQKEKAT